MSGKYDVSEYCECEDLLVHRHCPYCGDSGVYVDDPLDFDTDGIECEWCYYNVDSYFLLVNGYFEESED